MSANPDYISLLVRLWREPASERPPAGAELRKWLIQVEHIPDGEKQYFASLEGLFDYLRAKTGAGVAHTTDPPRRAAIH